MFFFVWLGHHLVKARAAKSTHARSATSYWSNLRGIPRQLATQARHNELHSVITHAHCFLHADIIEPSYKPIFCFAQAMDHYLAGKSLVHSFREEGKFTFIPWLPHTLINIFPKPACESFVAIGARHDI